MKRSKRYRKSLERRTTQEPMDLDKALDVLKSFQPTKFNETVEVAIRTGIDAKQTAQAVRGAYSLPHGIGKTVRVIAFCDGEHAKAATAAGAMEAGGEELAKKIQDGWLDFDVAIAHPSMMRHVGKLGRILGPQGKMPTPKSGTVTPEIAAAVGEFVAGKIEYRNDSGGVVHAPMGKRDFSNDKLADNVRAFLEHLNGIRPSGVKGHFIQRVYVKTTMSPSVPVVHGF